jgi:hypothetical protein
MENDKADEQKLDQLADRAFSLRGTSAFCCLMTIELPLEVEKMS